MARTYKRDSRGRFAGGGGSSRGGGRKPLQRGTNRLTRDNAGRITSVAGDGATARGGRLRTASGRQRATVTARGIGKAPAGTVGRSGRVKAPARVKAKPNVARRDKLQSGLLAGANDSVKQGLRVMGNRAINRVATAAKLSELQKAGKLNQLSPSQSRRAQSVFNDAQRKVNVAPNVAIEQRKIQLAIKSDKQRRNLSAAQAAAKPAAAAKPQNPAQIAGQRRRASETPEKSAQRRLERVRFREGQLQDKRRQLESSLNRRRGKLEGDQRRKATMDLRKTKISLDRISGARQQYENTVKQRQNERNWNIAARSRMKAPSNDKTARNRLNMLRQRVSFLSKNEPRRYDAQGLAYAGNKLAKARKDLSAAAFSVPGQRISFRSRSRAIAAQRSKAQKNLRTARTRGTMRNPAESQRSGIMSRISIGTAKQGNLLTGAFTKQRTGRPRPRR